MAPEESSFRKRSRLNQQRYRERQTQKVKDLEEQVKSLQEALARHNVLESADNTKQSEDDQRALALLAPQAVLPTADLLVALGGDSLTTLKDDASTPTLSWASAMEIDIAATRGRCSPRLVYGMLSMFDPYSSPILAVAPSDIIPFLPGTPNSFAKILFWRSMQFAAQTGHDLQRRVKDGYEADPYRFILGLPFLIDGFTDVLNRVEYRLLFFREKTVEKDHPGSDRDAALLLRKKMMQHMRSQGFASDNWLNPRDTEALLRQHLGPWKFALLLAAITQPRERCADQTIHDKLDQLASWAICFGDGPQWERSMILRAF